MNSFILHPQIANAFIKIIDKSFLASCYDESKKNSEEYIHFAQSTMDNFFEVSWSLGGTYGTCWDDEIREASEDDEPRMHRLIDFLKKNFFGLNNMEIEKICSHAQYREEGEHDYYGGQTTRAYKKIPFHLLGKLLNDKLFPNQDLWKKQVYFDELLKERSEIIIQFDVKSYDLFLLNEKLKEQIPEYIEPEKKLKL